MWTLQVTFINFFCHKPCKKYAEQEKCAFFNSRIRDPVLKFWYAGPGAGSGWKWTGSATLMVSILGLWGTVTIEYLPNCLVIILLFFKFLSVWVQYLPTQFAFELNLSFQKLRLRGKLSPLYKIALMVLMLSKSHCKAYLTFQKLRENSSIGSQQPIRKKELKIAREFRIISGGKKPNSWYRTFSCLENSIVIQNKVGYPVQGLKKKNINGTVKKNYIRWQYGTKSDPLNHTTFEQCQFRVPFKALKICN